ncbi:MAG: tetratricopeptide repeat protein [Cyclonatronaceae bacterium]
MISDVDLILPLLLEEKQLTEAGKKKLDKLARQLLKKKPETRTADEYFVLGYAADLVYDLEAAVTYFTDSIKANPEFEAAYRFRGSVLIRQEKFSDAETDIEKALALDPDYRDAKIDKARLLHETGKGKQALGLVITLEKEADPEQDFEAELAMLKGKIHDRLGNYAEAIACFDEVAREIDDDSEVFTQRALSKYFSGDTEGALSDLQAAQKFGPQGYIAHFNMALVLLSFPDRTKDAFRFFERAFKKDQDMLKNYLSTANEFESERLYDALKLQLAELKKMDDDQGKFYRDQLVDLLERKLP